MLQMLSTSNPNAFALTTGPLKQPGFNLSNSRRQGVCAIFGKRLCSNPQMASFFNNKARAAALASTNGASSSKGQNLKDKDNIRLQPWVEK